MFRIIVSISCMWARCARIPMGDRLYICLFLGWWSVFRLREHFVMAWMLYKAWGGVWEVLLGLWCMVKPRNQPLYSDELFKKTREQALLVMVFFVVSKHFFSTSVRKRLWVPISRQIFNDMLMFLLFAFDRVRTQEALLPGVREFAPC